MFTAAALKWYVTSNNHKPRWKSLHRSPFLPSWNLYKVELFFAFISQFDDISSRECSWKCKSLQFERKKTVMISSRIRTCDTEDPVQVYHANL